MKRHRSRLPLALLGAVVAAGAATLILRPRGGVIDPLPVETTAYFSPGQLERADDFRDVQRLLGIGGLAVSGATLVLLTARPPQRLLGRLGRRPLLGASATGAGISLLLMVVGLPLSAVAHQRSVDFGLSTQNWGEWLVDLGKSAGVETVLAAFGGGLALALVRRYRRRWWVPGAVLAVILGAVSIWLFPVVVEPIFNRFDKLPPGPLRSDVLRLAHKAGVDVGEVYRVDASRQTTGANAYVNGLGPTKRVVLYDNLIKGFPEDEVRQVVAHELGHQKQRDIYRGLAWLALVAPAGTFLAQALAERFGRRQGLADLTRPPGPAVLPALLLSLALVSFGFQIASNALSRRVEASADSFGLRMTDDAAAHIELERRLALTNIADPDPPKLLHLLFGTHPTTVERIGIGLAYAHGER